MLLTSVLTRSRPRARTVVAVSPSRARHLLVCMGAQGHYEVERKFAFRTSDVGAQPFKHRTGPRLRSARLSRGMVRGGEDGRWKGYGQTLASSAGAWPTRELPPEPAAQHAPLQHLPRVAAPPVA